VEGSNVTFKCIVRGIHHPHPRNWFYQDSNGHYHPLTHTNTSLEWTTQNKNYGMTEKISEQPNKGFTAQIFIVQLIYAVIIHDLFLIMADIKIETVVGLHDSYYAYFSRLHLINVTLNTPYTKFKCEVNNTFKEISLKVKGKRNFDSFDANKELTNHFCFFEEINNNPTSNPIALEKQMTQNLTCNRFSQFVPIQWLKVIRFLFDFSSLPI
jgi:hypothetical protein